MAPMQTLLPMAPAGELCNVDGSCVDAQDDEIFKLTTRSGARGEHLRVLCV